LEKFFVPKNSKAIYLI